MRVGDREAFRAGAARALYSFLGVFDGHAIGGDKRLTASNLRVDSVLFKKSASLG